MAEAIIGAVAGVVKGLFGLVSESGQQRTERMVETARSRSNLLVASSVTEGAAIVVVLVVVMIVLIKS